MTSFSRRRAGWALPCIALLAAAGAGAARDPVREYVDQTTAVSVTVTDDALIFARERTDLAANARDYITFAPLEINRSGSRSYFWLAYIWSTIDRRNGEPLLAQGDELVLLADGRPIRLLADAGPLQDHGVVQQPIPAPKRDALALLFSADTESIAYAARATDLHIELLHDGTGEPFTLWKGARESLLAFAEWVTAD